jgi:hypothetical protein
MAHGVQKVTAGLGIWRILNVFYAAFCDQVAATLAGARPDVDDVVGVANRVFIVLNDYQRIAFVAQTFECAQQNLIVPRVQSNGRLV